MSSRIIKFEDLQPVDLAIDCTYEGGTATNHSAEPLRKILPHCPIAGGFRIVKRKDGSGLPAYVILFTSMSELEWPDFIDVESGIFRYYGDNRTAGDDLLSKTGNKLLLRIFEMLHTGNLKDIPPFLIFEKGEKGRDRIFRGLAVPGNPSMSTDKDLVAFWRTVKGKRFQNFESYFTILDTRDIPISQAWLNALRTDHVNSLQLAPEAWKKFVSKGRSGIVALKSTRYDSDIPDKYTQLAMDEEGRECLNILRHCMQEDRKYHRFEACAADLVSKLDPRFGAFKLTRPWRDGGRDAIGHYGIGLNSSPNLPLKIDFALEAKCYAANHGVGVKEMSRLISRIRYRQFGVMVTTSYVDTQAYREVVEDEHPILILTGRDIATILHQNGIHKGDIADWVNSVQTRYERLL